MKKDYKVDLVIKSRQDNYWYPQDNIKGLSVHEAIELLESKYSHPFKKKLIREIDAMISFYPDALDGKFKRK